MLLTHDSILSENETNISLRIDIMGKNIFRFIFNVNSGGKIRLLYIFLIDKPFFIYNNEQKSVHVGTFTFDFPDSRAVIILQLVLLRACVLI